MYTFKHILFLFNKYYLKNKFVVGFYTGFYTGVLALFICTLILKYFQLN
jgi:hypothetical protein